MRLLVWLALAAIVYLALRSKARNIRQNMRNHAFSAGSDPGAQGASMQKKADAPVENMVDCAYCHIYLPASDAISLATPSQNHYFCCEEHVRLHSSGGSTPASASTSGKA